ncbi:lipid kinase [Nocardioides currus]|uniref:Lipid kinase n=1 Tax=Nocardioides currus TaxID=2133958 RepID=A0A2R7YT83_9ACTN|nr:lipid kinase [Nocardioides currus]PUA79598.1 lipid kinase [Nocardioides currus]
MPSDLRTSHLSVVVNTASRTGAAAVGQVTRHLQRAGVDSVDVHPVASGSELPEVLAHAAGSSPDILLVGGGDGSMGCAAELLADTGTALGVLPLGTANDFARTLEIPATLAAALDTVLTGTVVVVDLGRANGRVFLNVASLGLSVEVTQRLTPRLKRRLGQLAYPVATLAAYRHHRPFAARIELPDGSSLELEDLMQLAVGNGRHYGGGLTVSPTASIDDHLLDVYAVEKGRLRDHVSVARLLRSGDLIEHERVHHLTNRAITVTTDRPMPVNLDGEIATHSPATFEVERNALHVVVPRHSRAAQLDGPPLG